MQVSKRAARGLVMGFACGWILFFSSQLQAASVRLSELINQNSTVLSGDKEFSEFRYASTGDMPFAENINVLTYQDSDGNYGIRFQGAFLDSPDPHDQGSDALITYKVRAVDPTQRIASVHLAANIVAQGTGTGTITETFFPIITGVNDYLRIPSTDDQLINRIEFNPPREWLPVQKNILLRAVESQVDISFIDQTFGQVPEPSSLALAGWLGLAAMGFLRRRNS